MSIFAKTTPAPTPRSKDVSKISTFYAAILVIFSLAQLFTFESFLQLFGDLGLSKGFGFGYILAAVLVTLEVFAIPFLLRMRLSPAFRLFSAFAGIAVAAIWLFVSLWIVLTGPSINTVGFLGTAVVMMPGWWAVSISLALGILAIWSVWGMWPELLKVPRKKRR